MDKRVKFDFEVTFTNGGGLQGQDFRLDLDGDDISDQALADYLARELRLLMVGSVRILNKQIIAEAHQRSRPSPPAPGAALDALAGRPLTQVGLVVANIEQAARDWAALLGVPVPNISTTDSVDLAHTEHNGQPTAARARLAFFHFGPVALELIEPLGEPSTWNDQLAAHGPSLHHIAFEVKGMPEVLAQLAAAGLPLAQRGDYTGGRYAYIESGQRLGAVIELLENNR
jgi:methylmalonyl-CoA/ethylmalonyl-CoA epimerase